MSTVSEINTVAVPQPAENAAAGPALSVKAFSELIHLPAYGQAKKLREQKYPRQGSASFRMPYYRGAVKTIRDYFKAGNDPAVLEAAEQRLVEDGLEQHKTRNNLRVLASFRHSDQRNRKLDVRTGRTWRATLGGVLLRGTPDLTFAENDRPGYMFIDCQRDPPDEETVRTTVELLHHVLNENGAACALDQVEYMHLGSDHSYHWHTPRAATLRRAKETAMGLAALWNVL